MYQWLRNTVVLNQNINSEETLFVTGVYSFEILEYFLCTFKNIMFCAYKKLRCPRAVKVFALVFLVICVATSSYLLIH